METSKKAGEPQPMQVINNYGTIIIHNAELADQKAKNKMDFAAPNLQNGFILSGTGDFIYPSYPGTCVSDSFSTS